MKTFKFNAQTGASTGAVVAAIAVIAIGGAGFAAYKAGYLPFGNAAKAESELKAEIEGLKGEGIKTKIIGFAKNASLSKFLPPEELAKQNAEIDDFMKDVNVDFQYGAIATSTVDNKAKAELTDVKLAVKKAPLDGYISTPKVTIARAVDDKNHYFFESPGITDIYTIDAATPTPTKIGSISSATSTGEIKLNDAGDVVYTKSNSTDIKIIEANGGTTLLSIASASAEAGNNVVGDKLDIFAKSTYKDIVPGDLAKMFIGKIDPISLNFDYAYKGDDFISKFAKLIEQKKAKQVAQITAEANPAADATATPATTEAAVPATPATTTPESFDGDLKVADVSLLIGDAGLVSNASLNFKKENPTPIPFGDVTLKIAQYQKLLELSKKFVPTPKEVIDNGIAFLSEIGENANGNFTFNVKFDGTENILVGGKTLEQVAAIRVKYYPTQPSAQIPVSAE